MYRVLIFGIALALAAGPAWSGQSSSIMPLVPRADAVRPENPRVLPGTLESAFGTVQGHALDAASNPLPRVVVRLRDARLGRISATQQTDVSGRFEFRHLDPGSYIVELLDDDQSVLAASDLVHVNAADSLTALVKLPPRLSGWFGRTTQQAAAIIAAAAASGVLASSVVGVDSSARR